VTKLKPLILSRRRPEKQQAVIVRHARHVGEILIAWNDLQSKLFMIFWVIVSPERHQVAYGIWHCIQSDKTQRDMVLAAARGALAAKSRMLQHIEWLVDRAAALSVYRNDPAHTAIGFTTDENNKLVPVPDLVAGRDAALKRLADAPTSTYWERVRGDLWSLSYFAGSIWAHLLPPPTPPVPHPFPRRPRLMSIPAKKRGGRPTKAKRRSRS
jgi:hypothetical protein